MSFSVSEITDQSESIIWIVLFIKESTLLNAAFISQA
jgi:hypothetical protein